MRLNDGFRADSTSTRQQAVRAPDRSVIAERLTKLVSESNASPYTTSGAVFGVSSADGAETIAAAGVDAAGRPINEQSPMFLASASKLATGCLILRLVERGILALDEEIGAYLPEAAAARTSGVTIRRLLSHTSGLPIEIPHDLSKDPGPTRWQKDLRWPAILADACLATPVANLPGETVQYSNVAYGLLGLAASRRTGRDFAELMRTEIFDPLGIQAYVGEEPEQEPITVADVPSPYAGTGLEPYNNPWSRGWGAPWACVVTNASGLLALVRIYLDGAGLLSPDTVREARKDHTRGANGGFASTDSFLGHEPSRRLEWDPCPWGLAIELQGGKQPHWAPASMPDSFGQIGSSGCLGWCDPVSGTIWAVLGARTTHSGWLLRHGARIAQSAITAAARAAS